MLVNQTLALTIPGFSGEIAPEGIPSGAEAPSDILQAVMSLMVMAVVVGALIFILYGGILWTTSQGDKQKIDKARRTITFSIVGIVVAILAFVIIQVIGSVIGSELLSNFGKPPPVVPPGGEPN